MNASSQSSSGSTASVGSDVGDEVAPVTKTTSLNTADSCTWYANSGCRRPRTCYDCLNVQISSGECAIMPNGMCVNLADYSNFLNKQEQFGIYYKYYPSTKYTYCSADDAACSSCTSNWVSDYNSVGAIETPASCTGVDGCICVARCELPDWSSSILTDQCSSSGSFETHQQTSTASRIGFALAVGIAFGALLGLWGIKVLFRGRGNGRGRGSSVPAVRETWAVPRRSPTGPQLALTGWKDMREKLIAIEQEAYGEIEEAGSAAADASDLAMEEGNVYHQVSPRQSGRRSRNADRVI